MVGVGEACPHGGSVKGRLIAAAGDSRARLEQIWLVVKVGPASIIIQMLCYTDHQSLACKMLPIARIEVIKSKPLVPQELRHAHFTAISYIIPTAPLAICNMSASGWLE